MSQHKDRRDLSPLKPISQRICSVKQGQKPFGISGASGWSDGTRGIARSERLNGPTVRREMSLTIWPPLFPLALCRVKEYIFPRCFLGEETEVFNPLIQMSVH